MTYLKKIRLALALAIFIILLATFLGIPHFSISTKLAHALASIQLVPALLAFSFIGGATIIIVIALAILTWLFGRIYCSSICPLGTYQDIISRISTIFKKRKIFRFSKARNIVRYSILVITILSLFSGSILLLNFLDPYSNFGKIVSGMFRPAAIWANDGLSKILSDMGWYGLPPIGLREWSLVLALYPIAFFSTVSIMAAMRGRLFCNTVCPVGALLGFVSKYSMFKIKINQPVCTRCGKCSTVCKAECIDLKSQQVDFSRCVACYNCIKVCPEGGIKYMSDTAKPENNIQNNQGNSRRSFLQGAVTLAALGVGIKAKAHANKHNENDEQAITYEKKYPVSPPGSYSIEHFNRYCTACHLCVSVCPSQVLQPSKLEYGWHGIMQPHLNFETSFCNYECVKCSEVCPTGAILPISSQRKVEVQIGKVVFLKENCVVYVKETACGACSEHCPTKAVAMVPYKGWLTIPETNVDICVGCGACEFACPERPYRAIYVEGNPFHQTAFPPCQKAAEGGEMEEFPF